MKQVASKVTILSVLIVLTLLFSGCSRGQDTSWQVTESLISIDTTKEKKPFDLVINKFTILESTSASTVFDEKAICGITIEYEWKEGGEKHLLLSCSTYEELQSVTVLHSVPLIVTPSTEIFYKSRAIDSGELEEMLAGNRYYYVLTDTSIQDSWITLDTIELNPLDGKFSDIYDGDILEVHFPGDMGSEEKMNLEKNDRWLTLPEYSSATVNGYAFSQEEWIEDGVVQEKYFTICIPDRVETAVLYHTLRINYITSDIDVNSSEQQEFEIFYEHDRLWLVE